MDQTSDASVNAFIQRVKNTYGKIDLLVLNAGEQQLTTFPIRLQRANSSATCNLVVASARLLGQAPLPAGHVAAKPLVELLCWFDCA